MLSAADGGDVTLAALGADPLALGGVVASAPAVVAGPIDLGRESIGYDVTTTGRATVTVELDAAPPTSTRIRAPPTSSSPTA